jgi:hypothetical protein
MDRSISGAGGIKRVGFLFHGYSFRRALVDAGLTLNAEIRIDFCLPVYHGYGSRRADIHTGLTGGAFLGINYCWQTQFLQMYLFFYDATQNKLHSSVTAPGHPA